MNSQNHKDALEQFLTDETNKHEMFASDAVWAKINNQVQKQKSWPALTVIAFMVVVGLSLATALNYPPDNFLAKVKYNDSIQLQREIQHAAIIAAKPIDDNFEARISPQKITEKTFATIANKQSNFIIDSLSLLVPLVVENTKEAAAITTDKKDIIQETVTSILPKNELPLLTNNRVPLVYETITNELITIVTTNVLEPKTEVVTKEDVATDNIYKDFYAALVAKKHAPKRNKWTYDIYVTPSKSYRNLEDDKERDQYAITASPSNTNTTNNTLNNIVKHKPALGLELGFNVGYNVTNRLKFTAGAQFNIRQYHIDAYQTFGLATIAIVQNNRLDSLSIYTRFGSAGSSYAVTILDNRLYQLSIPLGLQWDAIQGKKLGISVGASVQPTFTLNKNVFLISTDYKYYADGESFFRKWNFNTALNLNVSYKLKNAKIYLGPQVRYQHLPTYNDAYPIKEYRLDYGVKVGIIKAF
jgi:hypothetical protein